MSHAGGGEYSPGNDNPRDPNVPTEPREKAEYFYRMANASKGVVNEDGIQQQDFQSLILAAVALREERLATKKVGGAGRRKSIFAEEKVTVDEDMKQVLKEIAALPGVEVKDPEKIESVIAKMESKIKSDQGEHIDEVFNVLYGKEQVETSSQKSVVDVRPKSVKSGFFPSLFGGKKTVGTLTGGSEKVSSDIQKQGDEFEFDNPMHKDSKKTPKA